MMLISFYSHSRGRGPGDGPWCHEGDATNSCQERRLDLGNSIPKYPKCPLGMFDCQILFDSVKEMPQNVQYHED